MSTTPSSCERRHEEEGGSRKGRHHQQRSRWPTTWPTTPASTDGASAVHAAWAVRMTGISKRFGAVAANDDANLSVRAGTVHGIVGENGAGKSTLMSVL